MVDAATVSPLERNGRYSPPICEEHTETLGEGGWLSEKGENVTMENLGGFGARREEDDLNTEKATSFLPVIEPWMIVYTSDLNPNVR